MKILKIENPDEKATIVKEILSNLPEWFGIAEAKNTYIQESKKLLFWACFDKGNPMGCIVLKQTGDATMEIYVMGVKKQYQRLQIGKQLVKEVASYARKQGFYFLQVKTVKQGIYKEYDMTNAFYKAMGFYEFECIDKLWDIHNPCQIYIKYLHST